MSILVVGVPETRTINGKPLDQNIVLTASDIGSLGSGGGDVIGDLKVSGSVQSSKMQVGSGADGVASSSTIVSPISNYVEVKTPSTGSSSGIVFTNMTKATGAIYYNSVDANTGVFNLVSDDTSYSMKLGSNFTANSNGTIDGVEFRSTGLNTYRQVRDGYGSFWRSSGGELSLMITDHNDAYGSYNNYRPFTVELDTGKVTLDGKFRNPVDISIAGVSKSFDGSSDLTWNSSEIEETPTDTVFNYTGDSLTSFEETFTDGVKTTSFTYTNSKLTKMVEIRGNFTRTTTYNYTGDKLTSVHTEVQ